jgi:hypothetical protein
MAALAIVAASLAVGYLLGGPGAVFVVLTVSVIGSVAWIGLPDRRPRRAMIPLKSAEIANDDPSHAWGRALKAPTLSLSDKATLDVAAVVGSIMAIVLVGGYFYATDLSSNPPGFFSDEAEIGLESERLLSWDAETTTIPFFYQHFEYPHLGTLPLFTTAPFVAFYGLSDETVRFASVFMSTLAGIVVFVTLRRLCVPFALVPVLMMMLSPIVVHVSRLNFGHAPSVLFICLGNLAWIVGRQAQRRRLAALAGLLIGLAAYGQASFYLAVPLFVTAIVVTEILYNRRQWAQYWCLCVMVAVSILVLVPVPVRAMVDREFLRRYREKNGLGQGDAGSIIDRLQKIPDYFSYDFLFRRGDGSWLTRHSIPRTGLLSDYILFFLLLGVMALLVLKGDGLKRYFLPFFFVLILFPIPDAISNRATDPPYTFATYWAIIAIPFVVGYGFRGVWLLATQMSLPLLVPPVAVAGTVLALATGISFWRGPYADYPAVAADYWGWQYGPERMIDAFKSHRTEYDQFIMTGDFNGAYMFLDFYLHGTDFRDRAIIGDFSQLDLSRRQLFGVRKEQWERLPGSQVPSKRYFRILETIRYPNGTPAFYLVAVRPEHLHIASG